MERPSGRNRNWAILTLMLLLGLPSIGFMLSGAFVHPLIAAGVYGVGILAGAFLLSWAAEVAEIDISASLAIIILVLLTVLPEFAVEVVLAWDAGASFDTATREVTPATQRVAANVTGANRMLIGVGWSAVILVYWFNRRQPLDIRGQVGPEVTFLTIATLLTLALFFMEQVHFLAAAALIAVYLVYLWVSIRRPAEEPDLAGIPALLGSLPAKVRRLTVAGLFVYAAAVILVAADPFVKGLVETGQGLGIDDFILIQWVAPLASETPEMLVAVLFSLRSNPAAGLMVLLSSEVGKFTLLVGSMVGVFSLSAGQLLSFPLDHRQAIEFLLTAAFSLFGLLLIARQVVDWKAGAALLATFVAHLFFPQPENRWWMALAFFGLAALLSIWDWRRLTLLFWSGTVSRAESVTGLGRAAAAVPSGRCSIRLRPPGWPWRRRRRPR